MLRKAVRHKVITIGGTVALLIILFVVYGNFNNGIEFFPEVEPQQAYIYVNMSIGTNLDKSNEVTSVIEQKLPPLEEIECFLTNVGS